MAAFNSWGSPQQGGASPNMFSAPQNPGNNMSGLGQDLQFDGNAPQPQDTGIDWGGTVAPTLQGIGGLAQSWLGFQQLGLAKDQFNFQKDAFTKNYDQQAQSMNTQMSDRQSSRVGYNPNAYQSVGDYMAQNEVKSYGG